MAITTIPMSTGSYGDDANYYLDYTPPTLKVNAGTLTLPVPTAKAKATSLYSSTANKWRLEVDIWYKSGSSSYPDYCAANGKTGTVTNNAAYATLSSWSWVKSRVLNTSQIFNSSNSTSRVYSMPVACWGAYAENVGGGTEYYRPKKYGVNIGTLKIELDVPPTFSNGAMSFDTNFDAPYAGLTTASVDISNITAYYGGYITKATLKIGNQTAELTGSSTSILSSGTLSILLDAVGTFTPTITVTDSRGQTKTVSLEAITVKGYSAPQVSINEVLRTDENGLGNDEGKCAVVTATFTWTSAITDLDEPTLVATELDDTLVQTETKWYTDRALQDEITVWSEVSNMPVYAFIGNTNTPPDPFDTQDSFNITITPNDEQGTGTPVTATLGSAFYTVDFLAGGHGIAFGKPAETQELFECDLNAQFNKQVLAPNYFTQLDTTEPPDTTTTDGQIYQALKDLGWTDVIV